MDAFIRFHKGLLKLPVGVQIWLVVLMTTNFLVPLFYLDHLEAQVVLATFFVSFFLMILITGIVGFTRLMGAGHVLWFPLLYFLWIRVAEISSDSFLGLWVRVEMALIAISLVIDFIDVVRYFRGAREEIVQGL
jgi:hypothetical protein